MRLQNKIGIKTKEAIEKRYGTKYTVGSIAEAICKQIFLFHVIILFYLNATEKKKFFSKIIHSNRSCVGQKHRLGVHSSKCIAHVFI